jgi:Big-like domain-containing protein
MAIGIYKTCPGMKPKRKLPLFLCLAVLLTLTLAAGCRGFFVNPKLTSLTVNPTTTTISQGQTQAIVATGNFDDGSTKNLTGTVTWTSSTPSCATVSSTGVVTAATTVATTCTTTISATSGAFTATATITVTPGSLISINLMASATSVAKGSTVTFTAKGTYSGSSTQQDITNQVSWIVSDTTILTMTQGSGSGTISSSATSGATVNVSATLSGITSNTVTITVQ